MTSLAKEQLVTLVGNYYHGLVTFQSYRQQRNSILDGLRDPAPSPIVETAPRGIPAPAPQDETKANAKAKEKEKVKAKAAEPAPKQEAPVLAAAPRSSRRLIAFGAVAGVLAVVVVGWTMFGGSREVPSVDARTESSSLPPAAALLDQFIQKNVWDRDAADNLQTTWSNAFTEEQRQEAVSSPTFARFSETLRRRLREEEALSGIEGNAELDTLAALAGRFGVPYSRPQRRGGTGATGTTVPASLAAAEAAAEAADEARARAAPAEERRAEQDEVAEPALAVSNAAPAPAIERTAASAETSAGSATVAADAPGASGAAAPAPTGTAPAAPGAAPASAACSAALLSTRRPFCSDTLASGGTGPALAVVPPGEFEMGGQQTNDEKPPHAVTIGRAFAMSVYEISFGEFGAYCKATGERCPDNPWGRDDFPAALVSWDEAVAYAKWLSSETGQSYRLPSEAEWEYAARAGTRTRYPFGDDVTPVAARSSANAPVDSPLANSDRSINRNDFRLFHMIGNLREWVADHWYSGYAGAPTDGSARLGAEDNPRVVRGGAYSDGALQLRSAARASLERGSRDRFTGFRVVRELPP